MLRRTMLAWLVLVLFSVFAICFTLDPTPTIAEDTTDKTTDKNDQKKNSDVKHFCPKCKSHDLTFEGLNTYEGKRIQLIECAACGYDWQEAWTLPNWFWLKSTSPNNHWTSERWNSDNVA